MLVDDNIEHTDGHCYSTCLVQKFGSIDYEFSVGLFLCF